MWVVPSGRSPEARYERLHRFSDLANVLRSRTVDQDLCVESVAVVRWAVARRTYAWARCGGALHEDVFGVLHVH